jgi:membrane associated rhomboid family serine protease
MVGPSYSDDERILRSRVLKIGFTFLVGASGAMVAFQGGAGTSIIAAAFVGGTLIGAVLTWFVARNLRAIQPEGLKKRREMERRRRER